MRSFKIETTIVLLTVIIGLVVVTSGYLAYKSLFQIVASIHQDAKPDYKLLLIKEIASDLTQLEHDARLFALSGDEKSIQPDTHLYEPIHNKVQRLNGFSVVDENEKDVLDSVQHLIKEKLLIWEEYLQLHRSNDIFEKSFSDIYKSLEKQEVDTIMLAQPKKRFFKSLFGKKDTVREFEVVAKNLEKDEIKMEIRELESDLANKNEAIKTRESQLIEKNSFVTKRLNELIVQIEKDELNRIIVKAQNTDRLAAKTYKRLAAFSVTAVILLLVAIFMFFSYLRKSRAYQRALRAAKTEAENLTRAKERFVANVSHELRTPVNAIYGLAEQLKNNDPNNNSTEHLNYLMKASEHLKSVVDKTLDFSKIQAQKLHFNQIDFSPAFVFSQVMAIHTIDAQQKGIDLTLQYENELPAALLGDPVRLKQILINLVGNAIKFTEKGSVTIQVGTMLFANGTLQLHVAVTDTGIGISDQNINRIFNEFEQVETNGTRIYGGTGLGLAITKSLVEMQEGSISVESKPGIGTTFRFTIPYQKGNLETILKQHPDHFTVPEYFSQYKVLIADDEAFNRYLLKNILLKWGMKFHEVANGSEALQKALTEDFDLILMDIRMPVMNGIDATTAILKEKPKAQIVAITATNEHKNIELYFKAGMVGYLTKPFGEKELFDTMVKVLNIERKTQNETASITSDPSIPEINLEELKRLSNGEEVFFREMIELFIRSTTNGIKTIHDAIELSNWEQVSESAHKMAAPCKHLQANYLYGLIKQLEKLADETPEKSEIEPVAKSIDQEIEKINAYLNKLLSNPVF